MALQATNIADLTATTLRELGRLSWTDISGDLTEYVALPSIMRKERVEYGSGYEIQWNVMYDTSGAAKMVGLRATDDYAVGDVMTTASIPYRHANTNYTINRRELTMNYGPARIVDLVKVRRADAMIDLAKLMENVFWAYPSSTDTINPHGVDYYDVYNATTGFNGGNPSGHSDVAGINRAGGDNKGNRWKNFTAQYTSITKTDLIRKMREGAVKTNFQSPVSVPTYSRSIRRGWYTNYDVLQPMEEALEDQNENLGNDLASKDGQVMFRRNPVVYVPHLQNNSTKASADPVYGIDWNVFHTCFLRGEYLREAPPRQAPNNHTDTVVDVDLTFNWKCTDPRKLVLIAKSDPAVAA